MPIPPDCIAQDAHPTRLDSVELALLQAVHLFCVVLVMVLV